MKKFLFATIVIIVLFSLTSCSEKMSLDEISLALDEVEQSIESAYEEVMLPYWYDGWQSSHRMGPRVDEGMAKIDEMRTLTDESKLVISMALLRLEELNVFIAANEKRTNLTSEELALCEQLRQRSKELSTLAHGHSADLEDIYARLTEIETSEPVDLNEIADALGTFIGNARLDVLEEPISQKSYNECIEIPQRISDMLEKLPSLEQLAQYEETLHSILPFSLNEDDQILVEQLLEDIDENRILRPALMDLLLEVLKEVEARIQDLTEMEDRIPDTLLEPDILF